ncbi:MAG: opacity protein-like surface antigen [Bermanella sp.]|jgi:opacity protein-like surface antigen
MGTATTEEAFSSNVKPKQYLSWQTQYTFRPTKTVRPIVLAGLTYLKADLIDEYTLKSNGRFLVKAGNTKSDSTLGLVYGFGLDINFYTDVSFVLDYRIRPDIAGNSVDETNGSLKYQF